ncbi:MAG: hypothetical protein ACYCUV_01225 [Phycisphaerae bacterium]
MTRVDMAMPNKPQAATSACILVLLILFIIALAAISVVNSKVGRGMPVPHGSAAKGHYIP